ncbi:hypothetical protein N658DRAFT_499530 [Parathielavia hyrcaniae]|uniref:Uncharacterized protein n=1 Tax=Parathielavia hyrcaniae TaxID=113614 RepID=A0AAN6PWE5_9PEZI|nr:hypothetical protein N658DRAFT_499530 [Parathielavia hyrcaniae]
MDKLPAELNCYITGYLLQDRAFFSVAALARCNRLLCSRVLPQLYDNVGRVDLQVGQDALIWAVENDELGTMKTLLERGVDPDARFYSTLPYPVRQDVFSAQRLQRRLAPNRDGHLANKIVQATMVTRGIYMMARERSESRLLPVCEWQLALQPVFLR